MQFESNNFASNYPKVRESLSLLFEIFVLTYEKFPGNSNQILADLDVTDLLWSS